MKLGSEHESSTNSVSVPGRQWVSFILAKLMMELFQDLLQCCKFPKFECWNAQENHPLQANLGQPNFPPSSFLLLGAHLAAWYSTTNQALREPLFLYFSLLQHILSVMEGVFVNNRIRLPNGPFLGLLLKCWIFILTCL